MTNHNDKQFSNGQAVKVLFPNYDGGPARWTWIDATVVGPFPWDAPLRADQVRVNIPGPALGHFVLPKFRVNRVDDLPVVSGLASFDLEVHHLTGEQWSEVIGLAYAGQVVEAVIKAESYDQAYERAAADKFAARSTWVARENRRARRVAQRLARGR
jgi:hypothetical protein